MFFQRRTNTPFLLLLLMMTSAATLCLAGSRVANHVCHYDEIHKDEETTGYPTTQTNKETPDIDPLRITFSSLDLRKKTKYCDKAGSTRTDAFGMPVKCEAKDVLTSQKKGELFQVVRSAISMHTTRLYINRIKDSFNVPQFKSNFCNLFTVPDTHQTTGVTKTDMMLYIASFPSSRKEMFAAGAPCALQQSDNRPVAGALTYTTEKITSTMYSVRVAAHEIAHVLGFTYHLLKNKLPTNAPLMEKENVRMKDTVTTLYTADWFRQLGEYYDCSSIHTEELELEDEKGILNVTSRSHLKRRNALPDLMAGVVTAGLYTSLTIAALKFIRLYSVNASRRESMSWGYKMGCDFFTKRCAGDEKDFSSIFCTDSSARDKLHCSPNKRAMARCSPLVTESNLPVQYKYFDNDQTGEARLMTDRCPIYEEHDDLSCTDTNSNAPGVKGPDSWCFERVPVLNEDQSYQHKGICGKVTVSKYDELFVDFGNALGKNSQVVECEEYNDEQFYADALSGSKAIKFQCPPLKLIKGEKNLHSELQQQSKEDENYRITETKTVTISPTDTLPTSAQSVTSTDTLTKTLSNTITNTFANTATEPTKDAAVTFHVHVSLFMLMVFLFSIKY